MPHVVQRCSSLGDSVGAGLCSPWLLFVAVHGCSWPCMAAWWHCLLPIMMPCGSCPASVSIHFPAMCASFSPLCSCHDVRAGAVRQSVKREIPATLEDGDTGIVPFFLCIPPATASLGLMSSSCVPSGMYAVWWCVPPCGHVVWYVCRQVVCAVLRACRQRPKVFFISSTRSSFSHVKSSTSTSRVG